MPSDPYPPAGGGRLPRPGSLRPASALLLTAAAAAIRFYHLDAQSLWNDELFSLQVSKLGFAEIQTALVAHYHHPPLFFYLLHFVLAVSGESAWSLRLISALAGSATVGLVFHYASKMFGLRAGVAAAAVCLVAPFHIAYSQEGRPYALAALLALASCCLLFELLKGSRRRFMVLYVIVSAALLYTHHWGIFVLGAQAAYLLLSNDITRGIKKSILTALAVVAALYLPELPALVRQSGASDSLGWFWVERPGWREWIWITGAYSGTYFEMASALFDSHPAVKILGSAAVVLIAAQAVAHAFGRDRTPALRWVLACCTGTLLVPFAVSFVKPEVFLWYRYTVIVFPLFCVMVGAVMAHTNWSRRTLPAAAILIVVGLVSTVRYFSWSKSNVRDVVNCVDSLSSSGVRTIIRPRSFAPLLNYYTKAPAAQLDEAYLDTPLGQIVDTASAFIYVSLDVPNGIRDYMDGHLLKAFERRYPGEAHMGMIVGVYRQRLDE